MVQEGTVCYLLNKPCLLELSLSVISIVCCNKTRTEGEKLNSEISKVKKKDAHKISLVIKYSVAFQHLPLHLPQVYVVYSFFMSIKGNSLNTSREIIKDCHFEQLF